jgi:hypothetical protein
MLCCCGAADGSIRIVAKLIGPLFVAIGIWVAVSRKLDATVNVATGRGWREPQWRSSADRAHPALRS